MCRSLLAEIRDLASNGGSESVESRNTRRDKAKEEYGSFYEVTMPEKPKYPPPPPISPVEGLNTRLALQLDSQFIEDAYRIIIFGVEREKSAGPNDKERTSIHRLFRDFLGDMLGISPSIIASVENSKGLLKNYNVGCGVATMYGTGTVLDIQDSRMTIQLPFATAYLHTSQPCILYSTLLADKELKSLRKVAIGNQYFYLFIRLFQLLCSRLKKARESSSSPEVYEAFLNTLYVLLDCKESPEVAKYEERVRHLLGHGAYALLTMDKLIHHIIKHLTTLSLSFGTVNILSCISTDTAKASIVSDTLSSLYHNKDTRSNVENYKMKASIINNNQNQENLFLIEINRHEKCLFIEYMGTGVSNLSKVESNANARDSTSEPSAKKARRLL